MARPRNSSRAVWALAVSLAAAAALAWAPAVRADWSAPSVVATAPTLRTYGGLTALAGLVAVDSRGDVAVAWTRAGERPARWHGRSCARDATTPGCLPVDTTHLTVVLASGRVLTRTVAAAHGES